MDGDSAFTLVLDDPSGNSYIETPEDSLEKDPLLRLDHYERTAEQAEGIGLLPPEPAGEQSPDTTLAVVRHPSFYFSHCSHSAL